MARNFKELDCWKSGMDLVFLIYKITKTFPSDELYGLVSQMRRSAVSIPSNIAEGVGKDTANNCIQFLNHSLGSLNELNTQIEIARGLGYISDGMHGELAVALDKTANLTAGYKRYTVEHPDSFIRRR